MSVYLFVTPYGQRTADSGQWIVKISTMSKTNFDPTYFLRFHIYFNVCVIVCRDVGVFFLLLLFFVIGIVDFLQDWSTKKKFERAFKIYFGRKDPDGLSVMEPKPYKLRFQGEYLSCFFLLNFISVHIFFFFIDLSILLFFENHFFSWYLKSFLNANFIN